MRKENSFWEKINGFKLKIKSTFLWFCRGSKYPFICGLAILLGFIGGRIFYNQGYSPEYVFPRLGGIFQILGIGTVAWGIKDIQKQFNQASFKEKLVKWWKSAPFIKKKAKGASHAIIEVNGPARIQIEGLKVNMSLKERIEELEEKVKTLENYTKDKLEKIKNATDKRFDKEREEIDTKVDWLGEKLENVSLGGVNLEKMGLVWLVIGILLTSFPEFFIFVLTF